MKVAVLGSGPSGLLAAHAARQQGHEVNIISPGSPSVIGGAQYLHVDIPGVTQPEEMEMVVYTKVGTKEGYAKKVYGAEDAPVSWDIFGIGEYPAWPMERTYQRLWDRLLGDATDVGAEGDLGVTHIPATVQPAQIASLCQRHDLVLSSVPCQALCFRPDHLFKGQAVYTADAPMIGVRNLIVYNGREDDNWYRASNLFGHHSLEISAAMFDTEVKDGSVYQDHAGEVSHPLRKGIKPVHTNCDCHLHHPNYVRIGRFGTWKKGVLVSHAYNAACAALKLREHGHEVRSTLTPARGVGF